MSAVFTPPINSTAQSNSFESKSTLEENTQFFFEDISNKYTHLFDKLNEQQKNLSSLTDRICKLENSDQTSAQNISKLMEDLLEVNKKTVENEKNIQNLLTEQDEQKNELKNLNDDTKRLSDEQQKLTDEQQKQKIELENLNNANEMLKSENEFQTNQINNLLNLSEDLSKKLKELTKDGKFNGDHLEILISKVILLESQLEQLSDTNKRKTIEKLLSEYDIYNIIQSVLRKLNYAAYLGPLVFYPLLNLGHHLIQVKNLNLSYEQLASRSGQSLGTTFLYLGIPLSILMHIICYYLKKSDNHPTCYTYSYLKKRVWMLKQHPLSMFDKKIEQEASEEYDKLLKEGKIPDFDIKTELENLKKINYKNFFNSSENEKWKWILTYFPKSLDDERTLKLALKKYEEMKQEKYYLL